MSQHTQQYYTLKLVQVHHPPFNSLVPNLIFSSFFLLVGFLFPTLNVARKCPCLQSAVISAPNTKYCLVNTSTRGWVEPDRQISWHRQISSSTVQISWGGQQGGQDTLARRSMSSGGTSTSSPSATWLIMRQIWSFVGAATRTHRHLLRTGSITCKASRSGPPPCSVQKL